MAHDVDWMLVTVAVAIFAGITVASIAQRIKVSAIVLLLAAGVGLGPEGLNVVRPDAIPTETFGLIVSLAVGLILFEGGLTLDLASYKRTSGVIHRLLTIGVMTTWLGTAFVVAAVFGLPSKICVLAASLVIVTGPTVIGPLLKRIRVTQNLHGILHWEGVLIDPVGVFIALLVFEFIAEGGTFDLEGSKVLGSFAVRVVAGLAIGVLGGGLIDRLVRWRVPPRDMVNSFVLGCAMLVFAAAEAVIHEAGLLSVTAAGFVLGALGGRRVKSIREFKAELTDLMVGMLFILLASRLKRSSFEGYGTDLVVAVAAVMLLVRPLNVLLSSWRLTRRGFDLTWREMAFLSWVAPRGIVSASMASLIALKLADMKDPNATFIEVFTYSVIVGTVVIQGFTAGLLARVLGVRAPERTGWLIVGAHALGRQLATYLRDVAQVEVVLLDSNAKAVEEAREQGLTAVCADARDVTLEERPELRPVGNLLALTDNGDLNVLLCQAWVESFGVRHVFRWGNADQPVLEDDHSGTQVLKHLRRPSRVSGELVRGEAALVRRSESDPWNEGAQHVPIMAVEGRKAVIAGDVEYAPPDDHDVLELHRETERLSQSLDPTLILRVAGTEVEPVMQSVAESLSGLLPWFEVDEMLARLLDRDALASSGIGFGCAALLARSGSVQEPACAIVRLPDGVALSPRGGPVRLLFLMLAPFHDDGADRDLVPELKQVVANRLARRRILEEDDPAEVIRLIRGLREGAFAGAAAAQE